MQDLLKISGPSESCDCVKEALKVNAGFQELVPLTAILIEPRSFDDYDDDVIEG